MQQRIKQSVSQHESFLKTSKCNIEAQYEQINFQIELICCVKNVTEYEIRIFFFLGQSE